MQLTAFCNGVSGRADKSLLPPQPLLTKTLRIMRLMTFLLTAFCIQVSASTWSQTITYSGERLSIETVLKEVKRQTGFFVLYDAADLQGAKPVTIKANSLPLTTFLSELFARQPVTFLIQGKTIFISKRPVALDNGMPDYDEERFLPVIGLVKSSDGTVLAGATVRVKGKGLSALTDEQGRFTLTANAGDVLIISYVGFQQREVKVSGSDFLSISLVAVQVEMDTTEVIVNTGYQQFTKEKTTGSFTHVGNELINRSMGPDIFSRLEGITGSLAFIRKDMVGERRMNPVLQIRGKSTIHGNGNPLIIVDNFPYEGDIYNINPNDINSVTLLKDAAASSIWGARAGNGVIVITTKKGQYNQAPSVNLTSNFTVQQKPDLYYSPYVMSPAEFIEVEKELFNRGFYIPADWTAFSPVVESLIANNTTTAETLSGLSNVDFRDEASRLFYRNSLSQQYALNFRGGGGKYSYYISAGYDQNQTTIRRDDDRRYTMQTNFIIKPDKKLEFTFGHNFILTEASPNGLGITSMYSSGKQALLPYTIFTNQDGSAAAINRNYRKTYVDAAETNGLLDWHYRPLEELYLNNTNNKTVENRVVAGINYNILPPLRFEVKYQYLRTNTLTSQHYNEQSFYARDMVNRFTQQNGTRVIPAGAIHQVYGYEIDDNSFRSQLNYEKKIAEKHQITGMGGMEIRQTVNKGNPGYILYGVDEDVLVGQNLFNYTMAYPTRPTGAATIPAATSSIRHITDRYLSYYVNLGYLFNDKYSFSFSSRKDGANIYGVKTNQKFVPLWHAGLGWVISKEDFWGNSDNFLKARFTFGYSGNSFRSVTAFATARYRTNSLTGLEMAELMSPGNPSLQWEKVRTKNMGIDFSWFSGKLKGNIDYYIKDGLDLIGDNVADPTTGLGFYAPGSAVMLSNRTNYAATKNRGLDIEITSRNLSGVINWSTTLLLNTVKGTITRYNGISDPNIFAYTAPLGLKPPIVGSPTDVLYSIPWHGLSATDGSPLVMVHNNYTTQYSQYINLVTPSELIVSGSSVPTMFGSVRNTIEMGELSLSANFSWKSGYYFRAPGIDYYNLFNSWLAHKDFTTRWQKPGDELFTTVPSMPTAAGYDPSGRRDLIYTNSQILVEKGDHIRWNDINLNYTFNKTRFKSLPANSIQLSVYVQNIGVIWHANSRGIDPDYPYASYPPSLAVSFGVNAKF